jgi:hypothetical protein
MSVSHDAYRHTTTVINVAYATAGGTSATSGAFGSQTRYIRITTVGVATATADGVRFQVGSNPVANSTTPLLPINWVEYVVVSPGERIAALSNNATTGSLNVVELTN